MGSETESHQKQPGREARKSGQVNSQGSLGSQARAARRAAPRRPWKRRRRRGEGRARGRGWHTLGPARGQRRAEPPRSLPSAERPGAARSISASGFRLRCLHARPALGRRLLRTDLRPPRSARSLRGRVPERGVC